MSNLNDFLNIVAAGKQDALEKSPRLQALKRIEESLKTDNPFKNIKSKPKPIVEQAPVEPVKVLVEALPEIKKALQVHSQAEIQQNLSHNASFQQPDPPKVDPNIKDVQNKLKFLEQAIGRIAALGPGSGAAEIYNLDMPAKSVTGDYAMGRKDYYVGVNANVKTYITLPTENVKTGRVVVVKDESGHAQLTPIKINGTIDNDPNGAEIRVNNAAVQFIYRDGWRII